MVWQASFTKAGFGLFEAYLNSPQALASFNFRYSYGAAHSLAIKASLSFVKVDGLEFGENSISLLAVT